MNINPPTPKARRLFLRRWHEAQSAKDVKGMEKLMTDRWLPMWLVLLWDNVVPLNRLGSNAKAVVEIILQRKGIMPIAPERPSERAMRLAMKGKNENSRRIKPPSS